MADSNTDYTKLTVPQLKARCKELKISGYSKLGKAALLDKLAQFGRNFVSLSTPVKTADGDKTSGESRTAATDAVDAHIISSAVSPPHPSTSSFPLSTLSPSTLPQDDNFLSLAPNASTESTQPVIMTSTILTSSSSLPEAVQSKKKNKEARKRQTGEPNARAPPSAPQKKQKLAVAKAPLSSRIENVLPVIPPTIAATKKSSILDLAPGLSAPTNGIPNANRRSDRDPALAPATKPQNSAHNVLLSGTPPATITVNLPSSRFRPLVPRPKGTSKPPDPYPLPVDNMPVKDLLYLDFSSAPPSLPPSSLRSISIPPSLSQRKSINAWSVILSGLSGPERRKCAFVSRAIRYAVYLSAIPTITREFGSRRFAQLPKHYSMSMTNFWPYLKQLRLELAYRQKAYEDSFLSRFFGEHMPIGADIWGCPDNEKQLTVALRFIMTRVWFAISVHGADSYSVKNAVVLDAHEVVKSEIWSITLMMRSSQSAKAALETFYVLEPTCEVIGIPPPSRNAVDTSDSLASTPGASLSLRVDWSTYVRHRMSSVEECERQPPLLACLKSTNAEEYTKGISKLWLTRLSKEGEVGEYKKQVAERYVLACVVGNSVSGQWMSSTHMAQVFAGTASESDLDRTSCLQKKKNQRVNLFLPAHHLVESVHFMTSGPKAQNLHAALAIVQTPGREYFILRDNGMEVGCEEDGVWPIWMELLGCDARGVMRL